MNVPRLRFEEFSENWIENTIQYFIDNKSIISHLDGNHGALYPKSDEFSKTGIPYITANDFITGRIDFNRCKYLPEIKARLFKKGIAKNGDVLFAHNATVGPCALLRTNFNYVVLSTTATYYRCDLNKINNIFLLYFFQSDFFVFQYSSIMSQSTRNQVPITTQRKLSLVLPSLPEQTKIANFLTAIDEKITQLTQKYDLLKQYKKGVMQQIFSQKLRFKDEDGREFPAWETKKLGEVFSEVTEKVKNQNFETYSITAGKGFVSQREKFGKDISGKQNSYYICLKPFQFAYNKGNSKTFTYGCVYANLTGKDIAVPNVFISFGSKLPIATNYYSKLFEWHYLDKFLKKLISSTARMDGLLNVSKHYFFKIDIPYPTYKEQTKIANFLTAIDDKITQIQTQLDAVKQYKKGLLQQMFV